MAFAHAEVLGPLVSQDRTNIAKNDQSSLQGCALDASHTPEV
jgi:hypothetical protein